MVGTALRAFAHPTRAVSIVIARSHPVPPAAGRMTGSATKQSRLSLRKDPGLLRYARNDEDYEAARFFFAFSAEATRLTGGLPSTTLIAFVAASSFSISTPVLTPMPSSM